MDKPAVSRRGVYYDLTMSPYEWVSPYGDIFKFSSKKKFEMYTRDAPKEIEKLEKLIARNDLADFIPVEIIGLLRREVYRAFYRKIEG